jgi:Tfp pilus assembly protein PilX
VLIPNTPNPKHRLANEGGFALIVAMFVLLIVSVLVAAAIAVASQTSTSTTRDASSKAALEAAEAGLQVAAFRLSKLEPVETACVTGTATAFPTLPTTGEPSYCAGSGPEPLGNGATFQYWTSKKLTSGSCAGRTIPTEPAGVTQRCITSEGIAGAVKPGTRLQTLVKSTGGEPLFTVKGILGMEEVLLEGSVTATGIVASNGKIIGKGSATFEKGFELCPPNGTFTPKVGSERNSSGVAVGNVRGGYIGDPPLEKERSLSECQLTAKLPLAHATATSNEDSRISTGEDPNTGEAKGLTYNAAKYELEVGAEANLTLKGSKYYFCKLVVTSDGKLKIASGAKVEIFMGSHTENSVCPKESKELKSSKETKPIFEIAGSAALENPNSSANLLIEMAGEGPLEIGASGALKASILAPEGEVVTTGAGTFTGAIAAKRVHLTAGSFIYSTESESVTAGGTSGGSYPRQAWEQCTPGAGASEGC